MINNIEYYMRYLIVMLKRTILNFSFRATFMLTGTCMCVEFSFVTSLNDIMRSTVDF